MEGGNIMKFEGIMFIVSALMFVLNIIVAVNEKLKRVLDAGPMFLVITSFCYGLSTAMCLMELNKKPTAEDLIKGNAEITIREYSAKDGTIIKRDTIYGFKNK